MIPADLLTSIGAAVLLGTAAAILFLAAFGAIVVLGFLGAHRR